MKKKGFTLIELLAVIVILAIVSVITAPIVINIVRDSKKQAAVRSTEGIIKSAKNYYASSILKNGDLQKKTIVFDGSKSLELEYEGSPPSSGVLRIDKDGNVSIIAVYDKWCLTKGINDKKIEVSDVSENKCDLSEILNEPIITLIGEEIVKVKENEEYTELGAIAKTIGGTILEYTAEIRLNGNIVDKIDATQVDSEYIITYKAVTVLEEVIVIRKVIIVDGTPPEITFEDVEITEQEVLTYDLMTGVTVTDNSGITPIVTITGSLSAIEGEYEITYKAVDAVGNETTKTRIITVAASPNKPRPGKFTYTNKIESVKKIV